MKTILKIAFALLILGLTSRAYCKPSLGDFGLRADIGVPDGLGFSLVYRPSHGIFPTQFVQVELGYTSTIVGGGIRGGATVYVPWCVSPSFTFEGGHQWAGNINELIVKFGGSSNESILRDVQYNYLNLHGGLSFGSARWFLIGIHAGMSYITGQTNGFQVFLQEKSKDNSLTVKEVNASMWVPSAKLVLQFYF